MHTDRGSLKELFDSLRRRCEACEDDTPEAVLRALERELEQLRGPLQRLLVRQGPALQACLDKLAGHRRAARFDALLPQARRAYREGRLEEALGYCERFLARLGDDAEVRETYHAWLGERGALERLRETVAEYDKRKRWEAALSLLDEYADGASLPDDLSELRAALHTRLRSEAGVLALAGAAEARGDVPAARRLYGRILRRRPLQETAQAALWRLEDARVRPKRLAWGALVAAGLLVVIGLGAGGFWWLLASRRAAVLDQARSVPGQEARAEALRGFVELYPEDSEGLHLLAEAEEQLVERDQELRSLQSLPPDARLARLLALREQFPGDLQVNAALGEAQLLVEALAEPHLGMRLEKLEELAAKYPASRAIAEAVVGARGDLEVSVLRELRQERDLVKRMHRLLAIEESASVRALIETTRRELQDLYTSACDDPAEARRRLRILPEVAALIPPWLRFHVDCASLRRSWIEVSPGLERDLEIGAERGQLWTAYRSGLPVGLWVGGVLMVLAPQHEVPQHLRYIACAPLSDETGEPLRVTWGEAVDACLEMSARLSLDALYTRSPDHASLVSRIGLGVRLPTAEEEEWLREQGALYGIELGSPEWTGEEFWPADGERRPFRMVLCVP